MSDIRDLHEKAYEILENDPRAAIAFVDSLDSSDIPPLSLGAMRASIYVDAGTDLADPQVIGDGILLLQALVEEHPERLDLSYNLANGFSSLAQTMQDDDTPWYLLTSEPRRWARYRFADVATSAPHHGLKAQALTNKANLLAQSHRWVEAFEAYRAAVALDPENVVASTGAAKILLRAARRGLGERSALEGLARTYLLLAEPFRASTRRNLFAGLPAVDELRAYEPHDGPVSGYAGWVAEERLPLSLSVDGLGSNDKTRWDSVSIGKLIEPLSTEHGVPPTFAALNVLKSDYLAARWVCYTGLHAPPEETGQYTDTLDYARYGVKQSLLVLSQKAAFDVLDKLAVTTSEYLGLDLNPNNIHFSSFWHARRSEGSNREWKPFVAREIGLGGIPLIALSEIAEDLAEGGYLHSRRELRHAGTHRLVVLHDLTSEPSRPSKNLTHADEVAFQRECLETLRLARAAILYLLEFIAYREARKEREASGKLGTLIAPSHEWIRGEDT